MTEVIDFENLSTHLVEQHDNSLLTKPSTEQLQQEKKSTHQLFITGAIIASVCLGLFIFLNYGGQATVAETNAYQREVAPLFNSIRQEFKNLVDVSCDEGSRNDCISYTFSFYPQNQDQDQGGVAYGVTMTEVNRIGEYGNAILQSKLKHLSSRKGDLTFTILSTNVSRSEGESKVTYVCHEYHEQMQCENK